ncbi:DUF4153 domain-containing protein [Sphingosinicellaceae bacterium]|nr:DUF4153 domain-containing protein [Sphingosinicellaceae bacterium]
MSDTEHRDWPLRAALLAVAGAAVALALHVLLNGKTEWQVTEDSGRLALAAFLAVGGVAYAFVVERDRQRLSLSFALVSAAIVAAVIYWNGTGSWDATDGWRVACALLTVAIAAPLFQAWRDASGHAAGQRSLSDRIPYIAAHNHAWTNVVLWCAACVFVGITWGLAELLAALFDLIGIHNLSLLLRKAWFGKMLTGAAFGGAVGLLRDRERVLGTLQRVVTIVLSVLAPVLAAGLLAFLVALPFTGLVPLWQATKSTTPILVSCVIGALLLSNSVIADRPEDESPRRALRWAAMGLGLAMLPLGVIAAVSTGLRINQYGLTPDRLWAVVFTGIACAYGLAYLVQLVRARAGWSAPVRAANLKLAVGLCGVAFVLSTPLVAFGALSTRDQVARLASGRTAPDKFDWTALRYDFGPSGKAAVERLVKSGATPAIRAAAATALKSESRWSARQDVDQQQRSDTLEKYLTILPKPVPLPAGLRQRIAAFESCNAEHRCVLLYVPGAHEATLAGSAADIGPTAQLEEGAGNWGETRYQAQSAEVRKRESDARLADANLRAAAIARGDVEVREVKRRQIFIGGQPAGEPFE